MVSGVKMPPSRRKAMLCTPVQRLCGGRGKDRVIPTREGHLNWASQHMQKFTQWDWTRTQGGREQRTLPILSGAGLCISLTVGPGS